MPLRYFGIRVTNLKRSLDFYKKKLKLVEIKKGTMYHGGKWVLLEDPKSHQKLELNWYPKNSPYSKKYEPHDRLDHIGFTAANPASTFKKLVRAGVKPALAPTDKNGVKGVYYLKDPDGNWLEFFG